MTINEEVTIVEYSPSLFDVIKTQDNIGPNDILQSLNANYNR